MTDSVEGITEYTYDALGQLLTEKHMAVGEEAFTDVNVMTYDGYGNIRSKNGVTFFLITAKRMKGPKDYTRGFTFSSITTWGITVSKASGSNISTYGVGFAWAVGASLKKGISIGKKLFGTAKGGSYYLALPINSNAKELYSIVESKV
ncbi:MAG: hypothetical protein J6A50_07160 [Clostridia bacterium]|nr:hypothetical protein [Clostridia bacterium]